MAGEDPKGDRVVVLTGRSKGRRGEVLKCCRRMIARWCRA